MDENTSAVHIPLPNCLITDAPAVAAVALAVVAGRWSDKRTGAGQQRCQVNINRNPSSVSINYVFKGATHHQPDRQPSYRTAIPSIQIQVLTVIYWISIDFSIVRVEIIIEAILLMDND